MQRQNSYKVHLNMICNGVLSDPLCDSVNRGLTLVRLSGLRDWVDITLKDKEEPLFNISRVVTPHFSNTKIKRTPIQISFINYLKFHVFVFFFFKIQI